MGVAHISLFPSHLPLDKRAFLAYNSPFSDEILDNPAKHLRLAGLSGFHPEPGVTREKRQAARRSRPVHQLYL